ncbi:polyribonucleotide nucleotidyltransferase [Candidatus Wolfebacteria bacterium CG1_02_39_135]|uniref:Polyribonucleotide nucleotidyltransferase n=3 Tax=Candidatus Wolfeibacteriota TaxID=1752735 RepID=A0A2M8D8Z4_9BACT|nr:polyribonucleotide nucleotidyltransferase [Parcubacteria group bacterium]NCO89461.1 polyribonucleotide nucleotidyltransferase [Candidatus Wolfebacteria bacterium]OIO65890.1 MAG: polyribonucleotide nucleotidyltransferase [Candidatus Wolfebacteria bacterium CG1_02_39_135]PIU98867.1 MAG: polyribonucleotide nucleotidyltransferase [Candidatus Wolfebacteria bacterium CG03_land_8_20_14_0_80_39_317]PJB83631.1 MAG: polyribonucleotide nucleotidyltransferase [Candidatus Wolfebacteria bacterium CG_4_9_1
MDLNKQQFTTEVGGKTLKLEISNLAGQASAAVLGTFGDTSVLATVVMGKEEREIDYFPLTIDYEERFYAAGKIIGSRFIRREGRPSENAVLSGRMIDRTLRPLFNQSMRRDVQIVITVLSYDDQNDPDFISLLSASTALLISEVPWDGPVAGLRLAKIENGELVINPTNSVLTENQISFECFVSGPENKINMVELSGIDAKEEKVINAFEKAQLEINKLVDFQKDIQKKIGKPKAEIIEKEISPDIKNKVIDFLKDKLETAMYMENKGERNENIELVKKNLFEYLSQEGITDFSGLENLLEEQINYLFTKNILELEKRPDGRKLDEIRPLYGEVGLFSRLHGSALFARGSTQALAATTLGSPGAAQLVETMEISGKRRFMLHYNFPPYSVGEIGKLGAPGRREIGHGALAERAIKSILPSEEEFPYTIRIVSEILSSNGSSSMATVCASIMSLMDAGVPIKKPVAGISLGIALDEKNPDGKYKIFTDIQGLEDHYGGTDFKVAGTTDGITAIQADVKIKGLTIEIIKEILAKAKKARLEILDFIKTVIDKPRSELSKFAPIIMMVNIKPEQIGEVIGPGGKMINKIIKDTGVDSIDIEEDGRVFITGVGKEKVMLALNQIKGMTREFQIGEIIIGKVFKILEFGAIVDLGGGKDGMIHISELKEGFVQKVEDVLNLGDMVKVKIIKVENGKIGLSLRGAKEQ